jgi:hypothetical protein
VAPERFSPLALARATVRASARAGAQLTVEASEVVGRTLVRRSTSMVQRTGTLTRAVVDADLGVGSVRLSPATLTWVRSQVATGLRTLMALPDDSPDRLRSGDPATMARAVLALIGGEEALLELPSPEEQIRLRFRSLLDPASSAGDSLHPALLTITAQLSADEARIVRHLDQEGRVPVLAVEHGSRVNRTGAVVADHLSMVVERAGGEHPTRGPQHIADLLRLGVCAVDDEELTGHPDHELVEAGALLRAATDEVRAAGGRPRIRRRTLRLTPLGRELARIALHPDEALTRVTLDGPPPPPPADRAPQLARSSPR